MEACSSRALSFACGANFLNLNNSPLHDFQGVPERVLPEERYHSWAEFGVKVQF